MKAYTQWTTEELWKREQLNFAAHMAIMFEYLQKQGLSVDDAALDAFRQTELAQTIPTAYEALKVRPEVYDVLYPLRPERGPFAE